MKFSVHLTLAALAGRGLQLAGAAAVEDAAASSAAKCCAVLEKSFPGKTFSATNQRNLYQKFIASYFSVNDRLTPTCAVSPKNTKDVAAIVGLLSKNSCKFAVKSGGHGIVTGSSNIKEGVTVDLRSMRSVSLNKQNKTTTVQPGAKWIDVYNYLDPLGWAIPGGRAGTVGVGGLTSGGGNSFFAARYGFACDNVKRFEVVLGNGTVVEATNTTNADLFTALKGSQNNLGIITKFDFVAFEQSDLWGGTAVYGKQTVPDQIQAFYEFTKNLKDDPYGSLIFIWSYFPKIPNEADRITITNLYEYTANLTGPVTTYPPPFKGFAPDSPIGPPTANTLRVANLSSLTGELNSPPELSNLYATLTMTNNVTILNEMARIMSEEIEYYKNDPFLEYGSILLQPLPRLFTDRSVERGGNVLGLDRYEDDNILFQLDLAWNGTQFDERARGVADKVMGDLTTYLEGEKALKDFQYINYAFQDQDPLGGYGASALGKIKAASQKYDVGQVFQNLVPGGFKLAGAGSGNKYNRTM
ncbi:MAG: hypothetical protein L6R36_002228 [Xanthoria steineri]|nr:MAG: hypothetical protein L6R36_002228 [Xanthoria steineri]